MTQFSPVFVSAALLVASNVFMTFAWYAHLKNLATWPAEENGDLTGFAPDGRSLYVESSIGSRQANRPEKQDTLTVHACE